MNKHRLIFKSQRRNSSDADGFEGLPMSKRLPSTGEESKYSSSDVWTGETNDERMFRSE